jgi:hypothetical protein
MYSLHILKNRQERRGGGLTEVHDASASPAQKKLILFTEPFPYNINIVHGYSCDRLSIPIEQLKIV